MTCRDILIDIIITWSVIFLTLGVGALFCQEPITVVYLAEGEEPETPPNPTTVDPDVN